MLCAMTNILTEMKKRMCDTLMSHKSTCVSGSDVFISSLNPVQMEEINKMDGYVEKRRL